MRSYNFMFRSNTFPEREKADLLIEPYNLAGYSNRELEKRKKFLCRDTIQPATPLPVSWKKKAVYGKQELPP